MSITCSGISIAHAQLHKAVTFLVSPTVLSYLHTYTYVILFLSGKKFTEVDEFLERSSVVCGLSRPPISTTPSGEVQLECSNLGCSSLWEIDQAPFYIVVVHRFWIWIKYLQICVLLLKVCIWCLGERWMWCFFLIFKIVDSPLLYITQFFGCEPPHASSPDCVCPNLPTGRSGREQKRLPLLCRTCTCDRCPSPCFACSLKPPVVKMTAKVIININQLNRLTKQVC